MEDKRSRLVAMLEDIAAERRQKKNERSEQNIQALLNTFADQTIAAQMARTATEARMDATARRDANRLKDHFLTELDLFIEKLQFQGIKALMEQKDGLFNCDGKVWTKGDGVKYGFNKVFVDQIIAKIDAQDSLKEALELRSTSSLDFEREKGKVRFDSKTEFANEFSDSEDW
jgi:hypothetical protein